ncbi:Dyp-type peroxidase [Leucobacter aridicollis]|uniref:Dye decolorizing peroxidase n=1 Tax=Leucobacter aridicollis TaxID=283878 RepID=A0A852R8T3_9MICO|nr:Dyp-type peroxidase [Leucobacter aridicollis]MBL3681695.1 Dyp-type peroxidase [Leucobacter aridicollis]NYD27268.1 dye decolorizing peroxidase [Leucobacter aridicollis]
MGKDQPADVDQQARRLSRRALLTGGAVGAGLGALLGGAGGVAGGYALAERDRASEPGYDPATTPALNPAAEGPGFGGEALPCHGAHQAGITTVPATHVRHIAYTLRPETDRDAIARMFRILTGDIEALTAGVAPLADPEPELAERPARLTITVGVGPGLVDRVDRAKRPAWLAPLPAFTLDKLGGGFDGGDLLITVQADDQLPVAHAARMLHRDLDRFGEVAWVQQGFRQARGAEAAGATMRNLMGQVDGTVNPKPEDADFDPLIWIDTADGQPWLAGGSAFVLRRIRMELDTWDRVDRPGREQTIGRTLSDGAALSDPKGGEHTPADFAAKNALGLPIISSAAHIRRATSTDPNERIVRRAVNYDDGHEAGLLFGCFQRDPLTQFVPIQQRLDEADLLNEWVTHTGSAVFAILPGFRSGETLGAGLTA